MQKRLEHLEDHIQFLSFLGTACIIMNRAVKKYFACASSKNDANATAWEAVKAIVVNSNAADHSVS